MTASFMSLATRRDARERQAGVPAGPAAARPRGRGHKHNGRERDGGPLTAPRSRCSVRGAASAAQRGIAHTLLRRTAGRKAALTC